MSDRMSTHTIFKDLEDHMIKNGMPHYLLLYVEQVKKVEKDSKLSRQFSEGMKELYEFIKKRMKMREVREKEKQKEEE
jgi:hypothetical protein